MESKPTDFQEKGRHIVHGVLCCEENSQSSTEAQGQNCHSDQALGSQSSGIRSLIKPQPTILTANFDNGRESTLENQSRAGIRWRCDAPTNSGAFCEGQKLTFWTNRVLQVRIGFSFLTESIGNCKEKGLGWHCRKPFGRGLMGKRIGVEGGKGTPGSGRKKEESPAGLESELRLPTDTKGERFCKGIGVNPDRFRINPRT
jgi:hypothetical protein